MVAVFRNSAVGRCADDIFVWIGLILVSTIGGGVRGATREQ